MRELREDRGFTLRYVSERLGLAYAEVKAFEHGGRVFQHGEVIGLLDLYGVYETGERERLFALARDTFRMSRWENDFDAPQLDTSLLDSLWLESMA
ncbi:helix-turn-helix domain-containing protein [Phytohabitans suffuscus]|uniref:HTH cro/C1-type domain-containing protein n=2 Tax=Phytohabitans suffuscus TaxID=624315 RepID=A0A6F8YHE5_9ACTN|nr:helix-turn-helix transcriptional regulator [Phytohabitans suffuscus]BCB85522.1 hypothetical protein Psuf_028350 [Phytohabitans suffuscus]